MKMMKDIDCDKIVSRSVGELDRGPVHPVKLIFGNSDIIVYGPWISIEDIPSYDMGKPSLLSRLCQAASSSGRGFPLKSLTALTSLLRNFFSYTTAPRAGAMFIPEPQMRGTRSKVKVAHSISN